MVRNVVNGFIVVVVLVLLCHHEIAVLPAQSYKQSHRGSFKTRRASAWGENNNLAHRECARELVLRSQFPLLLTVQGVRSRVAPC